MRPMTQSNMSRAYIPTTIGTVPALEKAALPRRHDWCGLVPRALPSWALPGVMFARILVVLDDAKIRLDMQPPPLLAEPGTTNQLTRHPAPDPTPVRSVTPLAEQPARRRYAGGTASNSGPRCATSSSARHAACRCKGASAAPGYISTNSISASAHEAAPRLRGFVGHRTSQSAAASPLRWPAEKPLANLRLAGAYIGWVRAAVVVGRLRHLRLAGPG